MRQAIISTVMSALVISAGATARANDAIYGLTQRYQQQLRDVHRQFRLTQEQLRFGFVDGLAQFRAQHHYAVKLCGPERSRAIRDIAHQRTLFVQQYHAQLAAARHQRTIALTELRRWYDSQRHRLTHSRPRPLPCGCARSHVCVHAQPTPSFRVGVEPRYAPREALPAPINPQASPQGPVLIDPRGPVLTDPRQSSFRGVQPEYRPRPTEARDQRRDSRRPAEVILAGLFELLAE